MLLLLILRLIFNVTTFVILPILDFLTINVPQVILEYVDGFFNILATGVNLFGFMIGPVGRILLSIVVTLQAFKFLYDIFWWVIRKFKFSS